MLTKKDVGDALQKYILTQSFCIYFIDTGNIAYLSSMHIYDIKLDYVY